MVAPLVAQVIVTVWGLDTVPPAGLITGVLTVLMNVYVCEATALFVIPAFTPMALTVVVAVTESGLEYTDEVVVGVLPLTV